MWYVRKTLTTGQLAGYHATAIAAGYSFSHICLFVRKFVCLFVNLFVCKFVCLFINLFVCLFVNLWFVNLFVCL